MFPTKEQTFTITNSANIGQTGSCEWFLTVYGWLVGLLVVETQENTSNNTIRKVKKKNRMGENICKLSDKVLVPRIYKELVKCNNEEINHFKNGHRILINFSKEDNGQ